MHKSAPTSSELWSPLKGESQRGNQEQKLAGPATTAIRGSPGMIVGDDTRTRVRPGPFEPRHLRAALTLARRQEDLRRTRGKTAQREGNGAGSSPARHGPVNAGGDPNAPTTRYGRVPAMIIRMRLRAGAAIPGRLSTLPLCPSIAGHGGSARGPQPGRRGAHDFHPSRRRSKALLRAESRSIVTYDHPRSPRSSIRASSRWRASATKRTIRSRSSRSAASSTAGAPMRRILASLASRISAISAGGEV